MDEIIPVLLVLAIGLVVQFVVVRSHARSAGPTLNASLALHFFSAATLIVVYRYYYPGGDIIGYHTNGMMVADALRYDFFDMFPESVRAFFHDDTSKLLGDVEASSTSSMTMVAGWLLFLLGDSLYAASMFLALLSYLAKVAIFHTLRTGIPDSATAPALAAIMLEPSAVFWTSSLLKEPVTMAFLGPLFLGMHLIKSRRRLVLATALVLFGAFGVAMTKPYVLLVLGVGFALWLSWPNSEEGLSRLVARPFRLLFGALIGLGLYVVSVTYFEKGRAESLADAMASQRRAAAPVAGGSKYALESAEEIETSTAEVSTQSQVLLAPWALATALFRPFLFEVRNVMQFATGLEMTWILILVVRALRRVGLVGAGQRVLRSPTLMLCAVVTVLLGVGTGLATSNLGALARYRAPMMIFWVLMLVMLGHKTPSRPAAAPST